MLEKIKHLFQRFGVCIKAYPGDLREFGLPVATARFWDVLLPRGKSKRYIGTLCRRVNKELASLSQEYAAGKKPSPNPKMKLDKRPVWVCWWQGEEAMPPVVKLCVDQMRNCLPPDAQLHIITWDNLKDYLELPEYIMDKFQRGLITNIHLTDILRYGLVCNYGGAWIDATVLLSDRIRQKLPDYLRRLYFTQRFASWEACPQEVCRGKWCNFFFMGQAECLLFHYVYEALLQWWQRHDRLIDYVQVDYVIWAGYCGVEQIRREVDQVPLGNEEIWLLWDHRNEACTRERFEEMLRANDFFKISYKGDVSKVTQDGRKTVYARILEHNYRT